MKETKEQKGTRGITLVALVITIIILLILAGITISSLTNTGLFEKEPVSIGDIENYIFEKAQEVKEKTQAAEENQSKILNEYENELNSIYISSRNRFREYINS